MTGTNINQANQAETINSDEAILNGQVHGQDDGNTAQVLERQAQADNKAASKGKPESEFRAAARKHGLTVKEVAALMGVNYGHLCSVANGHRPWTPMLREKVTAVLGEVPGQGTVYRRGGLVQGESTGIREQARALGLSQRDLADRVGVSATFMSQVARGRRNMSPQVQARVEAVLKAPARIEPAVCANRRGGVVSGATTCIRERARERGLSMGELSDLVGVSRSYMTQAARGHRNMSPQVQAKVEAVLEGPARVEAAQTPTVDPRALWDRMEAHGLSQNETARLAGISSAHLSQIMNCRRTPSGPVLKKLHGVLFRPSAAELVVPAEVKVMAWKKGGRNGVVVRGAGGPGGQSIRTGGRVPWGAEVEYAYRAGYDSRGQVSVTHVVDERGYSVMLTKPEPSGSGPGEDRTGV